MERIEIMNPLRTISADQLSHIDPKNGLILDVRTKMEHGEKHVDFNHAHIPLDELNPTDIMMRHGLDKDSEVYILCRSGNRATQAAKMFMKEGYKNAYVVEGGIVACEECGHKVKGHGIKSCNSNSSPTKGPFSLERQVRITAGIFVAIGTLLSFSVDPSFGLIPLLVGCGLIFAGLTDCCGMALLLTKAPWNKIKTDRSRSPGNLENSPLPLAKSRR